MEENLVYQVSHNLNVSPILNWMDKHFNTEDIGDNLMALPSKIAAQKNVVRSTRDAFKEVDLPRMMMELEMIDDIASALNPNTGKAMFSNDKLRDAELKRVKAGDNDYQNLRKAAKVAERDLSAEEDELSFLEQKFSAYQYVSNFVSAEMNLMTGLIGTQGDFRVDEKERVRAEKMVNGQPY